MLNGIIFVFHSFEHMPIPAYTKADTVEWISKVARVTFWIPADIYLSSPLNSLKHLIFTFSNTGTDFFKKNILSNKWYCTMLEIFS